MALWGPFSSTGAYGVIWNVIRLSGLTPSGDPDALHQVLHQVSMSDEWEYA
tara:strand:+ start:368 stop:520 length:153 start_codon:yes stop_codon:yes gene_type:complete